MATGARKLVLRTLGILGAGGVGLAFSLEQSLKASELELHPPKFGWSHSGAFKSLDHSAIRRGYEVYKNVCAACHSLKYVHYRDLVNVSHTEAEAKAEAAEIMVFIIISSSISSTLFGFCVSEQKLFYLELQFGFFFHKIRLLMVLMKKEICSRRPGRLSDTFPSPYPNEEAARFANSGALPPDLSLITLARHGGEDYVFALLTGYCDPPAGINLRDGLYYNPYFPGGAIGMAQALYNETIEYSDGTPAYASQLAKDVCVFLVWCSELHYDDRKRFLIKTLLLGPAITALVFYYYRFKWNSIFTRKIFFRKPKN
ncbi:cytochrome c1, heme protein, mitochondrial [Armadillidium vulgare]|nr:cytochrome c1, heme protein, mitochondrial [Armadillidium vulgare]